MRYIVLTSLFLVHLIFFGINNVQAQEVLAEDVVVTATFASSPNELTVIQLEFTATLNEGLVKNLERMAKSRHFLWDTKPRVGSNIVVFRSEETFKGYGYHLFNIMKENNISLNRESVEATFSK